MELLFSKWVFAFSLCCWLIFSVAFSVEGLHGDSKVRGVNLGGWLVIEGWIKPSLFDGIPNGDMLDGTQVQFKSVTLQKYISAENGGGMDISVNRDAVSSWETFTLWRVSESEFQFRTTQGQFLTCYGNGCSVAATEKSASSTETFQIERNNNGRVHIKIKSGTYLQTGEICLDILKNAWSPAWTLQSVCRAIIALMAHPEPDSPLNCDSVWLWYVGAMVGAIASGQIAEYIGRKGVVGSSGFKFGSIE